MSNPSFEEVCLRLMVAEVTAYNTNNDYSENVDEDCAEDETVYSALANRAVEQAVALQDRISEHYKTGGKA